MTIPELIETLCCMIGEMARIIDLLSTRLMQTGMMTEGEAQQVQEIQKRIKGIGISPPEQSNKDDGAG